MILENEVLEKIRNLPDKNVYKYALISHERKYRNGEISLDDLLNIGAKIYFDFTKETEIKELNNYQKIIIIDAVMGSGKTTYILNEIINHNRITINDLPQDIQELIALDLYSEEEIQEILESCSEHYICIVPTLDEVNRYLDSIQNAETYEPNNCNAKGSKLESLKSLIKANKNIVTTHALVRFIDEETIELLKNSNYVLIIDEELQVIEQYTGGKAKKDRITEDDIEQLYKNNYITTDEKGFIVWEADKFDWRYNDVQRLCNLHSLMEYSRNNANNEHKVFIWNFPYVFFNCFKKCYICTYLWNGSIQKDYFNLHNIQYEHKTLYNNRLVDYNLDYETEYRKKFKSLINIYLNDDLNAIGSNKNYSRGKGNKYPLCSSWYDTQNKDEEKYYFKKLQNNTLNYFRHKLKCSSDTIMWTTFKKYKNQIGKKGFKGIVINSDIDIDEETRKRINYVPCNAKGTNDYIHKTNLAYLIDYKPQPIHINFFAKYGIGINTDLYSLSIMLQWIWRSAIRNNEPINIYIPSEYMRTLLIKWLNCEI